MMIVSRAMDSPFSPQPSSPAAARVMRANRHRDTSPELALRAELHRRGFRYRVDYLIRLEGIRARPDIVFVRAKVAVYVDGCFWHRCPVHGTEPKANTAYWKPKLDANVDRDGRVTAALRTQGWSVVRVWEHTEVAVAADEIQELVGRHVADTAQAKR